MSHKDKLNFIKYLLRKIKENFTDYWIGYVSVQKQYIYCIDKKNRLYTISIIAGKFRKGQWFSKIDAYDIERITNLIRNCQTPKFNLYVNLGGGAYQEYTFNKVQKKMLLTQLEKILNEEEIYVEEKINFNKRQNLWEEILNEN